MTQMLHTGDHSTSQCAEISNVWTEALAMSLIKINKNKTRTHMVISQNSDLNIPILDFFVI